MKTFFYAGAALVLATTLSTPSEAAVKTCAGIMNVTQSSSLAAWREANTQVSTTQTPVKTSQARETFIQTAKKAMEDFLFTQVDTPEMVLVQAEGIVMKAPAVAVQNPSRNTIPLNYSKDAANAGHHYERVARLEVSNLGASGLFKGTLLLPVSGHTGLAKAKEWSTSDTFTIRFEDASGRLISELVKDAKSLDYITLQDIEMVLPVNQVVRVAYYRSGSGGPSGYASGRLYELVWDGQ